MDMRESINIEDLSAVAEEGQMTNIDNEYSFSRNRPLAMSTVARETKNQKRTGDEVKSGSFISNSSISTPPGGGGPGTHQLRLSFSAVDQSNPLIKSHDLMGSKSEELMPRHDESLPIHNPWDQPPYQLGSEYDTSTRNSSLGLIQVDAMSDLNSSEFNLFTPGLDQPKSRGQSVQGSSSDGSRTGSTLQSSSTVAGLGNSQQAGDSQTAFFRHDIETVKKKPSEKPATIPEGPVRQSLVFKEMFSNQHDGDVTLPEVNIENELQELDDDFGDFDETGVTDADIDHKEPPEEIDRLDSIYFKIMSKSNEGDGAETSQNKMFPSLSKVTLFDDVGSLDDLRNMDGKQTGQSSEIDTEDELEMARQSMGQEREVGAGQCDDSRASIPRPGVEGTSQQESSGNQFSIAMRQSAEGDVVTSPVPGDGGGGGDGSSDSESEDVRTSTEAKSFLDTFRPNFKVVMPPPSGSLDIEEERVKPMGDDLLTEKGMDRYSNYQGNHGDNESLLQSRYLAPTPMFNNDSTSPLQWTADENFSSDPGSRLEASGFNAEDGFPAGQQDDNPFGDVRNSFGSFGASPSPSPPRARHSQESATLGDATLEPPISPRTSLGSRSHLSNSPPKFDQPKFSLVSPQPSQFLRSSHKSLVGAEAKETEKTGVDLAFVSSLSTEAAEQKALVDEMVAKGNLGSDFTINEDFVSSDQVMDMLDMDEKEFEKENIFREDENMDNTDVFPECDSWSYRSKMTVADNDSRISVGQFMKSRSGQLGSLDGDGPRPDFGMEVKTPPRDRKPYPLIENTIVEQEQSSNIEGDGTLHMSDLSRFMASVSMSKDPKEIANMVMAWSQKQNTLKSKLPVRKGTSLKFRDTKLSSEDMTLSEIVSPQDRDAKNSNRQKSFSIENKENIKDMKENGREVFSMENKTNPDGEESDHEDRFSKFSRQTPPLSRSNDLSKYGRKTPPMSSSVDSSNYDLQTPPQSRASHGFHSPPTTSRDKEGVIDGHSPTLSTSRTRLQLPGFKQNGVSRSYEKVDSNASSQSEPFRRVSPNNEERSRIRSPVSTTKFTLGCDEYVSESRSPRTSYSGWAGHHVPDGTEYSKSSDLHHIRSRQELEGIDENQLVDSRGFDAINEKSQDRVRTSSEQFDSKGFSIVSEQSNSQRVEASQKNSLPQPDLPKEKKSYSTDFDPRKHHEMLKAQANKHRHTHSADSLPLNGHMRTLTSTPVKDNFDLDAEIESHRRFARTMQSDERSDSPKQAGKSVSADSHFSQTVPTSIYAENEASSAATFKSQSNDSMNRFAQNEGGKQNHPVSTNENLDHILMPPPSISSFQHNLLPKKQSSENPTLLTSESMLSSDFAKEYLVRENPSKLVSRNVHPKPLEHPIDSDTMFPHRDSDIPLPTHYDLMDDNTNISTRLPCYQSTPYNNRVDMTVITPSSMHTMMSTGMMHELQAENLTIMDEEGHKMKSPPYPEKESMHKTPPRLSAVTAPRILHFSDVCCVGISTEKKLELTNPTNSWLECYLHVQEWIVDGKEVSAMNYLPFEMKRKVIIEPKTTESVTVIFIPKMAGAYVAQLNVTSSLFLQDNTIRTEKIPTVVTLQAIAEDPQIQVRTDSNNKCMNFGEVSWGSCHEMSLQIINRGQATIPLRLSILLSQGSWHAFSFDTKLADVSVISRSSRPQSASIGRTVMPLSVPGRSADSDPTIYDIKIYCRPPEKQYNRAMSQYPPTEMFARVEVEVDTPSHLPLISSIDLHAVVGVAKLHMSRQLEVHLKTSRNKPTSQTFNLRNAGNINMEMSLAVIEYQEYFIVNPAQFTIPPGEDRPVTVTFHPTHGFTVPSFETILLMRILPQGPEYDLPIKAEIQKEAVTHQGPVLFGNQEFIDFGGVAMGKSVIKKYTLKNMTPSQLKLSLEIRTDTDSFQLLWNDRKSYTRELMVNGGEKYLVNIEYRPTAVRQHHGKLVIKPEGIPVKYSIPLEGYGGTSLLVTEGASVIEGTSLTDQKYLLNFNGIEPSKCQIQKLTIRNVGSRAAYVKALCFTDPSCKHLVKPPKILIEPNEFVVKEKGASCVTIVFNPTERECALCSEGREIVAAVAFLCGDEVSRQRMRRVIRRIENPKRLQRSLCDENVLYSINFDTQYLDEDTVPDLPSALPSACASKDVDMFYRSMTKMSLTLVASSAPTGIYGNRQNNMASTMHNGDEYATPLSSRTNLASSFPANYLSDKFSAQNKMNNISSMTLTSASSHMTDRLHYTTSTSRNQQPSHQAYQPPTHLASSMPTGSNLNDVSVLPVKNTDNVKESVSHTMPGPILGPLYTQPLITDDKSDWTIKPDQLILHAPSKGDNRPEVSKFQIINFLNKELSFKMSWLGQWVKITPETVTVQPKSTTSICISPSARVLQNMETLPWRGTVHVSCGDQQYKTLHIQIRTDIQTGENEAVCRNLVPLFKQPSTATAICIPASQGVQTNMSQVNFPPTKVGEMSETYVDVTNVSKENLRWTISVFAPPYVKGADNSKDVFRATYKVFSFSEKYGHLDGGDTRQICVQFMPRSRGTFSQYWEVQSRGSASNNVRIELKGEGFEEDKKQNEADLRKRREAIFTIENEEETREFPVCDIGHVQILKVQIKNRSNAPQPVEVISPQLPFVAKHSSFTLKPRNFVRYPIEFRPSEYGSYDGLVIFKANVGHTVSCKVHGVCQKLK